LWRGGFGQDAMSEEKTSNRIRKSVCKHRGVTMLARKGGLQGETETPQKEEKTVRSTGFSKKKKEGWRGTLGERQSTSIGKRKP